MHLKKSLVALLSICAAALFSSVPAAADIYSSAPFDMPRIPRPSIPDHSVSITDFGGVGDGKTDNTKAFADAFAALAARGGGRLIVPQGIWETGPISLESHVDLHLERGALIMFTDDKSRYPLVETTCEGLITTRCQAPISADGKTDIAITGFGTFNGRGEAWRPVKKSKLTDAQWSARVASGGALNAKGDTWYPSAEVAAIDADKPLRGRVMSGDKSVDWNAAHDYLRPVLVSITNCTNILLEDVTFENSPMWNIHPLLCRNLIINRITVRNPWFAQNGDGLDVESCTNVIVTDSSFDVGDDAICIKSGKDKDGRDRGVPCTNVLIDGCTVYHGHGGFVIGSEMSGGVSNIAISNCVFIGTDVGLRFKSTRGRGGVVEKIWVDGIKMVNIPGEGLIFDLYYGGKGDAQPVPVTVETPAFRDITITNTVCRGARRAIYINGLPEMPVTGVTIRNSAFTAREGVVLNFCDNITLDNVDIDHTVGEPVTTHAATRVTRK